VLRVCVDSQLVIKQMRKEYDVADDDLKILHAVATGVT
jgi:ribonuclease HI